jgi:hypothetical protein
MAQSTYHRLAGASIATQLQLSRRHAGRLSMPASSGSCYHHRDHPPPPSHLCGSVKQFSETFQSVSHQAWHDCGLNQSTAKIQRPILPFAAALIMDGLKIHTRRRDSAVKS